MLGKEVIPETGAFHLPDRAPAFSLCERPTSGADRQWRRSGFFPPAGRPAFASRNKKAGLDHQGSGTPDLPIRPARWLIVA